MLCCEMVSRLIICFFVFYSNSDFCILNLPSLFHIVNIMSHYGNNNFITKCLKKYQSTPIVFKNQGAYFRKIIKSERGTPASTIDTVKWIWLTKINNSKFHIKAQSDYSFIPANNHCFVNLYVAIATQLHKATFLSLQSVFTYRANVFIPLLESTAACIKFKIQLLAQMTEWISGPFPFGSGPTTHASQCLVFCHGPLWPSGLLGTPHSISYSLSWLSNGAVTFPTISKHSK